MVVVQGTNEFNDYSVFLRAMGVVLSSMNPNDTELAVYVVGSKNGKVSDFAMEFCNVSEKGMKSRGKKINLYKTTDAWIETYLSEMNYFAFFSNEKQPISSLAKRAKDSGVELGIFQY
jgi:nucleoid-associated protein YejK